MAAKQVNGTQSGMVFTESMCPAAIIAVAMIPITFCESFIPCPRLNSPEDTNCRRLKVVSALRLFTFLNNQRTPMVIIEEITIPISGANTMKEAILMMVAPWIA